MSPRPVERARVIPRSCPFRSNPTPGSREFSPPTFAHRAILTVRALRYSTQWIHRSVRAGPRLIRDCPGPLLPETDSHVRSIRAVLLDSRLPRWANLSAETPASLGAEKLLPKALDVCCGRAFPLQPVIAALRGIAFGKPAPSPASSSATPRGRLLVEERAVLGRAESKRLCA